MSNSPSINTIIHLCGVFIFGYAIYWQEFHMKPLPLRSPQAGYAGHWKYLTNWDMALQFIFFTISLTYDLLPRSQTSDWQTLRKVRDNVFHGLVFPTALYVSIIFWALYAIDRELIFPRAIEPYYPNWLNHIAHTLVTPFVFIESYINYHKVPSNKVGLTLLLTLVFAYTVLTFYIALVVKFWVYAFMEPMSWPLKISSISVGTVFITVLYFIGIQLHKKLWSRKSAKNI